MKTFHPAVYAGILARRDVPAQLEELIEHGIGPIDLVVVNVKPFAPEVGRQLIGLDEAIELIDVGGAALLGAAARNAAGVTAVRKPGALPDRRRRAQGAGPGVRGDAAPAGGGGVRRRSPRTSPRSPRTSTRCRATCSRSGSRSCSRRSATCATARTRTRPRRSTARPRIAPASLADATQLAGSPPSFNNLLDLDTAYRIAADYTAPTVVIAKHTDPVGIASADELVDAYRKALETDPVASFGGIVGVNRELDGPTAREIAANSYEAVVAPGFSQAALGLLHGKAGLELLSVPPDPTEGMRDYGIANLDFKRVGGGLLVESLDRVDLDHGPGQVVTKRRPTLGELTDLLFAWRAVRHVRSNAIVLARNTATVGHRCGAGQPQRVGGDRAPARERPGEARRDGLGRVLPVPRRHPDGGQRRRHRDHPAGRLDPRRDGDRGRRPASPGDGVHRPAPLPPLTAAAASPQPETPWNSCSRSR